MPTIISTTSTRTRTCSTLISERKADRTIYTASHADETLFFSLLFIIYFTTYTAVYAAEVEMDHLS